jgi:hypothetical protein
MPKRICEFAEGNLLIAKNNCTPYTITNEHTIIEVMSYDLLDDYIDESYDNEKVYFVGKLIATEQDVNAHDVGCLFCLDSTYFRLATQQEIINILDRCNLIQAIRRK